MRRGTLIAGVVALGVVGIGAARPAHAQLKLEWGVEGYYRTRAVQVTNLAAEPRYTVQHPVLDVPIVMPEVRDTSYITHRFRISPYIKLENIARLNMEFTGLDNVVWGDNNYLSAAPLFAVNGTNQSAFGGGEVPTIQLSRVWMEFQVPVGVLRVGRMPSHWGMGILANGGGSANWDPTSPAGEPRRHVTDYYFDEDFGENNYGSTQDRILFATKPLSILRTIQKRPDTTSNVVFAYAFDKLSEAPLLLDEPDRRYRPFQQQGFLSRGPDEDDVNQHVFVLAYSNPDWDQVRYSDELKFGTYWALRFADQGFTAPSQPPGCETPGSDTCATSDDGSFVYIADVWFRIRYGSIYGEGEFFHIGGETTGGVPFPSKNTRKTASINGGVLRGGWMTDKWDALLELGYASGDDDIGDGSLTQRPLHPDFNVGLILYEEVIRERSARTFGPQLINANTPDGAKGFMSQSGVVNSIYIAPKGRWRPGIAGLEVVGQVLVAFVDKYAINPPNVFTCPVNKIDASGNCTMSKLLGTEFDIAIKSRFAKDTIDVSLEAGYLIFGDILKTTSVGGPNPVAADGAFSLQARVAFVF